LYRENFDVFPETCTKDTNIVWAPVRGHLYTMGMFDGDSTCRFCRKKTETMQHICCCEALARQRFNIFGNLLVEPKEISTASVRDLCLYIKGTGLLNLS
jgi:hypothetical protein